MKTLPFFRVIAFVLAAALFGGAANAQSGNQEEDIRRAQVFQIYLKSQAAVLELLDASTRYNQARSAGDELAMSDAASEMLENSTVATYWANVLDQRVQAEATNPDAKALSAEFREINVATYNNLSFFVTTHDLNELNSRLDNEVSESLTQLALLVRRIYAFVQEQW